MAKSSNSVQFVVDIQTKGRENLTKYRAELNKMKKATEGIRSSAQKAKQQGGFVSKDELDQLKKQTSQTQKNTQSKKNNSEQTEKAAVKNEKLVNNLRQLASTSSSVTGPLDQVSGRISAVATALTRVNPLALAVGVSIGAITLNIPRAVRTFSQFEQQLNRIDGLLKQTGNSSGYLTYQMENLAQELTSSTLTSLKESRDAIGTLLSFPSIQGSNFEKTLKLAQDVAEVTGRGIQSVSENLGKALADPSDGISRLTRIGIEFSESQERAIKSTQTLNGTFEAQSELLGVIESQYGGAAQSAAEGLAGTLDSMSQSLNNLLATLGSGVDKTGVLQFLNDLLQSTSNIFNSDVRGTDDNPFKRLFFSLLGDQDLIDSASKINDSLELLRAEYNATQAALANDNVKFNFADNIASETERLNKLIEFSAKGTSEAFKKISIFDKTTIAKQFKDEVDSVEGFGEDMVDSFNQALSAGEIDEDRFAEVTKNLVDNARVEVEKRIPELLETTKKLSNAIEKPVQNIREQLENEGQDSGAKDGILELGTIFDDIELTRSFERLKEAGVKVPDNFVQELKDSVNAYNKEQNRENEQRLRSNLKQLEYIYAASKEEIDRLAKAVSKITGESVEATKEMFRKQEENRIKRREKTLAEIDKLEREHKTEMEKLDIRSNQDEISNKLQQLRRQQRQDTDNIDIQNKIVDLEAEKEKLSVLYEQEEIQSKITSAQEKQRKEAEKLGFDTIKEVNDALNEEKISSGDLSASFVEAKNEVEQLQQKLKSTKDEIDSIKKSENREKEVNIEINDEKFISQMETQRMDFEKEIKNLESSIGEGTKGALDREFQLIDMKFARMLQRLKEKAQKFSKELPDDLLSKLEQQEMLQKANIEVEHLRDKAQEVGNNFSNNNITLEEFNGQLGSIRERINEISQQTGQDIKFEIDRGDLIEDNVSNEFEKISDETEKIQNNIENSSFSEAYDIKKDQLKKLQQYKNNLIRMNKETDANLDGQINSVTQLQKDLKDTYDQTSQDFLNLTEDIGENLSDQITKAATEGGVNFKDAMLAAIGEAFGNYFTKLIQRSSKNLLAQTASMIPNPFSSGEEDKKEKTEKQEVESEKTEIESKNLEVKDKIETDKEIGIEQSGSVVEIDAEVVNVNGDQKEDKKEDSSSSPDVPDGLKDKLKDLLSNIDLGGGSGIFDSIKGIIKAPFDWLKDLFKGFSDFDFSGFGNALSGIDFGGLGDAFSGMGESFSGFDFGFGSLGDIFSFDSFSLDLSPITDAIGNLFSLNTDFSMLDGEGGGGFGFLSDIFSGLDFSGFFSNLNPFDLGLDFSSITNSLDGSGISNAVSSFTNAIYSGVSSLFDFVGQLSGFDICGSGASFFHDGGLVGSGAGTEKPVYFHEGGYVGGSNLKNDEVKSVLQEGEYVINKQEVERMKQSSSQGSGGFGTNITNVVGGDEIVNALKGNKRNQDEIINVLKTRKSEVQNLIKR